MFAVFLTDGLHLSATVNPVTLSESCWLFCLRHFNETKIHLEKPLQQKRRMGIQYSQAKKSNQHPSQPLTVHLCVIQLSACTFISRTSSLCIIYNFLITLSYFLKQLSVIATMCLFTVAYSFDLSPPAVFYVLKSRFSMIFYSLTDFLI